MLCVPRKEDFLSLAAGERSCLVHGFSWPPLPAGCLWMDYTGLEKDFLAQREDQSLVLCGEGFVTGWQLRPPQNAPGCPSFTGETSCLWGRGLWREEGRGRGEGMFTFRWHLSSSGISNGRVSKGVRPLRRWGSWGSGIEVVFLVCQALMGSWINPRVLSKGGKGRCGCCLFFFFKSLYRAHLIFKL